MDALEQIGRWIRENEALISGIAAHPDPEKGREREAILRRDWPGD